MNRRNIFHFSVRRVHALKAIPIHAIPPLEYANVTQRPNARGPYHTASIQYQKGLRKKAKLQGLRLIPGRRNVG